MRMSPRMKPAPTTAQLTQSHPPHASTRKWLIRCFRRRSFLFSCRNVRGTPESLRRGSFDSGFCPFNHRPGFRFAHPGYGLGHRQTEAVIPTFFYRAELGVAAVLLEHLRAPNAPIPAPSLGEMSGCYCRMAASLRSCDTLVRDVDTGLFCSPWVLHHLADDQP
jgi:hypothetical protein